MWAEEFLELVYGDRFGWIDLPSKVGPYWVPWLYYWEGDADGAITRRIDSCLRDGESLYFSAAQYKKRARTNEEVLSSSWLWADLDERHPAECGAIGLLPTLAWESSPKRYQAMWRIDRRLTGEVLGRVNRALTRTVGADPGGWDLTQVLRIVGTRNYKYPGAPFVRLLWADESVVYSLKDLWGKVKGEDESAELAGGGSRKGGRREPGAKARALLRTPPEAVVEGERSARLWELECLLAEAGWDEEEIFAEVRGCAWNKHKGRDAALRREIGKAVRHALRTDRVVEREDDEILEGELNWSDTPFISFMSGITREIPEPRWMVEGLWTADSHGIIAGEPKTLKSTMALGLGLAVASGENFMGLEEYPVRTQGPVLYVNEENPEYTTQARMRYIAAEMGIIDRDSVVVKGEGQYSPMSFMAEDVEDFRFCDNWGFNLTVEEHREMLEGVIAMSEPALVILDPLYLMLGGVNYDRHDQLQPFLKWLKDVRYRYGCGIVAVHHYAKQKEHGAMAGGQRMLGSMTLHAWVDSAVYLSRREEENPLVTRCLLDTEFRSQPPTEGKEFIVNWGNTILDFSVQVAGFTATGQLLSMLPQDGSEMSLSALADLVGGENSRNDGHLRRKLWSMARGTPGILTREVKHEKQTRRYAKLDLNGSNSGDLG